MRRREFILAISSAGLASPAGSQAGQVPRIGVLHWQTAVAFNDLAPFREALVELGWIDGQNIRIEWQFAEGDIGKAAAIARQFAQSGVDVIVAFATPAAHAAKEATGTIPIVMNAADPLATGLVTSLARPEANITGISLMMPDVAAKRLELIKEVLPAARRVVFLGSTRDAAARNFTAETARAAENLGIELTTVLIGAHGEFEAAFDRAILAGADAVIVQPLFTLDRASRARLAELALVHRLPMISDFSAFARDGGLISYGPSESNTRRETALYVDRILRGAQPGDIPIAQPTRFQLTVNMKTAAGLGLTIPPTLLARADEVIE